MKIETLTVDFTDEQKRYLEGFTTGLQISRVGRGLGGGNAGKANAEPAGRMPRISRRRTRSQPPARSSPTRKNSSARSIRSMPIRG